MKLHLSLSTASDHSLEKYRPSIESPHWELVASGIWSEGPYHTGHIAYYLTRTTSGIWILDEVTRNTELDGVTEDDVEADALNDDQLQSMWGMSLEEAQSQEHRHIVAILEEAPDDLSAKDAAKLLYEHVSKNGGKVIDEIDDVGIIDA